MIHGFWNESKLLVNQDKVFTWSSKDYKVTFGFKGWTLFSERSLAWSPAGQQVSQEWIKHNSAVIFPSAPHDWYLMTRVNSADFTDFQVMQWHQELCPQRAVMHIPCPEEQGSQELQHHVVELHVLPNHLSQLLNHLNPELKNMHSVPRDTVTSHTKYKWFLHLHDSPSLNHPH